MNILFSSVIFFFGLALGSFLNCVIYRLETNQSFLKGRSFCPRCGHTLNWKDLIPVFSFLILRGRCRYCQERISLQYPLVEISTGAIFLLIFNFQLQPYGESPLGPAIFNYIIAPFLILIFVYDLKHYIIPDKIIYPTIIITIFYQLFGIWNFGNWNLFGIWDLGFGILPSLFFLAIILFSRGRWMGLGDFKLAILMGLILGWPEILAALFLAFFIGAIIGVGLILAGKKTMKSEVPFGPFLVTGTLVTLFWGESIIRWYLQLMTV
jgi:prepilin signal peptidase PulO-like enzyme (type II secretory pathway)